MNVKRIVLKAGEELPEVCWECEACQGISPDYLYCMGKHIDIDAHNTRPSWCPLVVDECCDWGTHTLDELTDDWKYCPLCGKRIKYVEVE